MVEFHPTCVLRSGWSFPAFHSEPRLSVFKNSRSRRRRCMTPLTWNVGGDRQNDRRSAPGGSSGLCGHGCFHVCPALFCDPLNPGSSEKNVGRAPRRPAISAGKVAHPVSIVERSLRESPRENGNRQPHVRVAACRLNRVLPNWECNVADLKHSVTTARA